MTYHSIGDSNCLYNTYNLPRVVQRTTGSTRMRDIADGTTTFSLVTDGWGVEPDDACFFHYGAIDVRCDVKPEIGRGGDASGYIARLVDAYLKVLATHERPNVEFWMVSLLPPPAYLSMPVEVRDHPLYPFLGTDEEISLWTRIMNEELERQGMERGYRYLDIHQRYSGKGGMMVPHLGSYMHVADNKPVLAEMHAQGLYTDDEAGTITGLAELTQTLRSYGP